MDKRWQPKYTITNEIATALMKLAGLRDSLGGMVLPPDFEAELRHEAKIRATHYSTRIEGNRLTLKQAKEVIDEDRKDLFGRERDVKEVKNYWDAITLVEKMALKRAVFNEELIKRIHSAVENGGRSKPTPYRTGQNVIRDSVSGSIVYMPPEAKDVPKLMRALVNWVKWAEDNEVPVPVIAALAHYQFVTIHPYYDGNGRTARLIATYILIRGNFGLNGIFSLEEYHAKDIAAYYEMLVTHPHHNYYEGRENADLTAWVKYFVGLMIKVFKELYVKTSEFKAVKTIKNTGAFRTLDRKAKEIYPLFGSMDKITSADIARVLKIKPRMAAYLAKDWVQRGFLEITGNSNKKRAYLLGKKYR